MGKKYFISLLLIHSISIFCFCQEAIFHGQMQYVATWGSRGEGPMQFKEPEGISTNPSGFIYIADTGNHRIQKINSDGIWVSEIGGFGWEHEQFDHPVAVSAQNGLDVFVADYYNQRIERYDKDLHYLASFHSTETWPEYLQFGYPKGIGISTQGELFCLDGENNRVLKLDVNGNPQLSFGDFNSDAGRLLNPTKLFVDQNRVFVSDKDMHCIVVFDWYGNFLFKIGEALLANPAGMSSFLLQFLVVADAAHGTIFIFKKTGSLVFKLTPIHAAGCKLKEPVDVACWRDRIYILDKKSCAIHFFRLVTDKDAPNP